MLLSTKGVREVATEAAYSLGLTLGRAWTDKAADESVRLVAWRLWDAAEADLLAAELQKRLQAGGWANKVKRTSVEPCYSSRTSGGEYVRVRAQSTTSGYTELK